MMMDSTDLLGRVLVDRDGDPIGKVTDIVSDPRTLEPEWLVVKVGRLSGEHLVPVKSVTSSDGALTGDFGKEEVRTTPRVRQHTLPTQDERTALWRHYGFVG